VCVAVAPSGRRRVGIGIGRARAHVLLVGELATVGREVLVAAVRAHQRIFAGIDLHTRERSKRHAAGRSAPARGDRGHPRGERVTLAGMKHLAIGFLMTGALLGSARADEAGDLKACNAGKAINCEQLAERYHQGLDGSKKDPTKAINFLDKACNLKSGRACNNLGTAWSEGKDGAAKVDHAKAGALYKKACELKNGLGCFNLGNVYRLGEGVTADVKVAFENFQKSCELDEAKGCTEEAIIHYEGKATKKDVPKAKELLDKACKLGSKAACKNLELLKNAK
jgi:TPR repeat protein